MPRSEACFAKRNAKIVPIVEISNRRGRAGYSSRQKAVNMSKNRCRPTVSRQDIPAPFPTSKKSPGQGGVP
jgi:hypothetical protein